jgi:hypothetical protein
MTENELLYQTIAKYLVPGTKYSQKDCMRFLDPCARTGEVLSGIANSFKTGINIETYGIEIDPEKGKIAQEKLTKCLISHYQNVRIGNRAFSLLFLMPPIGAEVKQHESKVRKLQRMELLYLKNCLKYLAPTAILIYVIPRSRISQVIAQTISRHFTNISVFDTVQGSHDEHDTMVIFGRFRISPGKNIAMEGYLNRSANQDAIRPNFYEDFANIRFKVPYLKVKSSKNILFASNTINLDELIDELQKYGLTDSIMHLFEVGSNIGEKIRPIMPMRHGHLAQALASGIMNGIVTDKSNANPMLVKGLTRKVIDVRTEGSGSDKKIIETDRIQIVINVFNESGDLLRIE